MEMEIETKIICVESIKPSPPIPKSLQKHHLSLLDQSSPPVYAPCIYLYQSNPKFPNSEISKQLKKSLSKVLSIFYPLAGRLVGNLYVDCRDGGAPFFEAEASCDLSRVNPQQNHKIINKFLPPYKMEEPQQFCLAVQATYFRCCGVALGVLLSHRIADGFSAFTFTSTWAAVARNHGYGGAPLPKFDAAAYFPPLQDASGLNPAGVIAKEEIATRIYTFPAATVSLLQDRYSGGSGHRPSRVEALSAFIWTQFISATGARSVPDKTHIVSHAINIRGLVEPPLSKYHFGNIMGTSMAMPVASDGGVEVVRKIREAVKAVNGGVEAGADIIANLMKETVVFFTFSSICGFPLYEADFGWGRPIWVGLDRFCYKNVVFFMDARSGGGIEALIHLTKQDMEKFEAHLREAHLRVLKSHL